jgi:hypothetical protein
MKTLREIYTELVAEHAANTAGEMVTTFSDKGTMHSYIEYYEKHFAPRRHDPVLLMEIGVMTGGSLLMWQQYFDDVQMQMEVMKNASRLVLPTKPLCC